MPDCRTMSGECGIGPQEGAGVGQCSTSQDRVLLLGSDLCLGRGGGSCGEWEGGADVDHW